MGIYRIHGSEKRENGAAGYDGIANRRTEGVYGGYRRDGLQNMKTIAEIKQNPKLEIQKQTIDGVAGVLHMTGLRKCTFIASWGGGWEHVSVCPENRCPDWDEMCKIKDMFWDDDEVVMQLHPAKSNYVNLMPNCLHLWRPIGQEIPVPPILYV